MEKGAIMEVPCDVFIPAAVGGVINAENAADLNCRFVVEAANVRLLDPSRCSFWKLQVFNKCLGK